MLKNIGIVRSAFKEKFCIPRRPHITPSIKGVIEILPPFNQKEAFLGLEEFNYIWVSFLFHKSSLKEDRLSIRPPRLGGNKKLGVFATRSPFRPNQTGLSAVKLDQIEYIKSKVYLHISGHDFLDGTPVYDIRPYLPESDFIKEANDGWTKNDSMIRALEKISFSDEAVHVIEEVGDLSLYGEIEEFLTFDPRPAYKWGSSGSYAVKFSIFDIHFDIDKGNKVYISRIEKLDLLPP